MRPFALLLVAVTAAALVGAGPVRCIAVMAMPVAPCHDAPKDPVDTRDAPRPLGAACCVAPAATPSAPAEAAPAASAAVPTPQALVAVTRRAAPGLWRTAEPPERPPGAPLALLGCFRI
ncbi:MAG TPA: hypothetical protein VGB53_17260 [Rubricoccaceae bacterium]|jgi:hypothetical protein